MRLADEDDRGPAVPCRDRHVEALVAAVEKALGSASRDEGERLSAIRRFFLEPRDSYSIDELAAAWHVSAECLDDICHDELAASNGKSGKPGIAWQDAVSISMRFSILSPFDVERALGEDFTRLRTARWRTVPVLLHLPLFVIDDLRGNSIVTSDGEEVFAPLERSVLQLCFSEHRSSVHLASRNELECWREGKNGDK